MGISKTGFFTEEQNELALIAKALAHPARIAIVQHLIKVNSCICNSIVNELPLAQPTVSQHLKELKIAGIIKGEFEGNTICYCINEVNWKKYQKLFELLFESYKLKNNCC